MGTVTETLECPVCEGTGVLAKLHDCVGVARVVDTDERFAYVECFRCRGDGKVAVTRDERYTPEFRSHEDELDDVRARQTFEYQVGERR